MATDLNLATPTFTEHLAALQRKLFDGLLEGATTRIDDGSEETTS